MKPLKLLAFLLIFMPFTAGAKITGFIVECDQPTNINYGTEVNFRFFVLNKKGKKEPLRRSQCDLVKITSTHAEFSFFTMPDNSSAGGKAVLFTRPKTVQDTVAEVLFTLVEDENKFEQSFRFRINYKGPMKIAFNGFEGKWGGVFEKGREVITHLSSNDGENGGNGDNGKDIAVTFLKLNSGYPDSFYVCRVITVADNQSFEFRIQNPNEPITIDCRGGKGGRGGDGTNGSKRNRYRLNGGNGGNGGTGGNGGAITVRISTNAAEIKKSITCLNSGGMGGNAGAPGKGVFHKSGDPELTGKDGVPGLQGMLGQNGPEPVIVVE
ncbi:MAG: hypothetical protein ACOZCO_01040 [Bacteroidota bacterium]